MTGKRRDTLHEQTARVLRDRIHTGIYPVNELLPPEIMLLAEFGVSRHTIRSAMQALVEEGLIERRPGRGTIVSPRSKDVTWGLKSIGDLVGEFDANQITRLKSGAIRASSQPEIAEMFGLKKSTTLFHVQRMISDERGSLALHNLYTLNKYAARLPSERIGYEPLIGMIEEFCRIEAVRTRQVASAAPASADVAKMLGVRAGSPLLVLRRTYVDRDDAPIEHTELLCRGDRYEQTVDFLREKKELPGR